MTEAEWLAGTDPTPMLEFLRDSDIARDRKLRLFAAACCRRAWTLLGAGGRAAVEASERFADGSASEAELRAAIEANRGCHDTTARAAVDYAAVGAWRPAVALLAAVCGHQPRTDPSPADSAVLARERASQERAQADLLRCVLGPLPFRPSPPLPPAVLAWNDGTVRRLAQAAYEERQLPEGTLDAARLALLADALLDAACEDEELMAHCRGSGPHVRGCWAVDLILGRE
jgi:hypothetical protein